MGKAENSVEGHLFDLVKARKGLCLKFSASIVNGVPDRVVVLNGHTVFVETKAPKGVPSTIQLYRHAEMRAAGADVRLVFTREAVESLVDELMARPGPGVQVPSTFTLGKG